MDSYIFYGLAIVLLIHSFAKDKKKTKMALTKAWKAFENILPEFLVVIILVGFLLAVLSPETISKIIGAESGWFGVILAGIIGSVTLIPGFVAFPTAVILPDLLAELPPVPTKPFPPTIKFALHAQYYYKHTVPSYLPVS